MFHTPTQYENCRYDGNLEFAFAINSHMVLQQAPSKAAVYGLMGALKGAPSITVTVSGDASYSVKATVGSGNKWKAILRPSAAGGNYSIEAKCTSGCTGVTKIVDVTFGYGICVHQTVNIRCCLLGVWSCANRDVWYCGGQSNMALPVLHTFHRNISMANILDGKYDNIRIHGISGNMNPNLDWTTLKDAVANVSAAEVEQWYGNYSPGPERSGGVSQFFSFSSTCYYFGESLTEKMGSNAPPIGLIHTAFGVSKRCNIVDGSLCRDVHIIFRIVRFIDIGIHDRRMGA